MDAIRPLTGFDFTTIEKYIKGVKPVANTFFEMHSSPEKYNEVYDEWLVLNHDEQKRLNAVKSRVYLTVEDIEVIQDGLEAVAKSTEVYSQRRRAMQMGFSLEEIKAKLIRRMEREAK